MRELPDKDLAAVCCYYNPFSCPARRTSFERFRERMSLGDVPMLVVEVATGDQAFELEASDSVVQRRSPYLMWYKSAGLNVGARHVIEMGYRNVVYLDADTYPLEREWKAPVLQALEDYSFVQVAGRVRCGDGPWRESVASEIVRGEPVCHGHDGAAWAARAELWTEFGGHFPYTVVGGDNRFMIEPLYPESFGGVHPLREALEASPALRAALEEYQSGLRAFVGSAGLGCADLDFEEVWHGSYWFRRAAFQLRYRFYSGLDPARDLRENDGLYEFRCPKQAQRAAEFMKLRELGIPRHRVIWENLRRLPSTHAILAKLADRFALVRRILNFRKDPNP